MKTIHKYIMPAPGCAEEMEMPYGFLCRHIEFFNGRITLWAEVDTDTSTTMVEFVTVGTGWDLEDSYCYVGTITNSAFVWHTFFKFV